MNKYPLYWKYFEVMSWTRAIGTVAYSLMEYRRTKLELGLMKQGEEKIELRRIGILAELRVGQV
jgi:hypothetical protein